MKKDLYINYDIEGTFWGTKGTMVKIKNEIEPINLTKNDELNVIINTPGGDIFESISVRDYLHSLECEKSAVVSGLCASAGTELFMSFKNRSITKGSFVMFHPAMGGAYGNRYEIQKMIDLLTKLDDEFIANYKSKLIVDVDNLEELIKDEWWLNADDFVKYFGGTLIDNKEITNKIENKINNTIFKETMAKFEQLKNGGSAKRPFNLEKFRNFYNSNSNSN